MTIIVPDALSAIRDKAMLALAAIGFIVLAPITVLDLVAGRLGLGLELLAISILLAVNCVALGRKQRPPVPHLLFLPPIAAALVMLTAGDGVQGALWSFPAILFFFSTMTPRRALACALILATLVCATLFHHGGAPQAMPLAANLAASIVIASIAAWSLSKAHGRSDRRAGEDSDWTTFQRPYVEPMLAKLIASCKRKNAPVTLLHMHIVAENRRLISNRGAQRDAMRKIVAAFQSRLRGSDIIFQLDDEQLLVALPDATESDSLQVARQLRALISQSFPPGRRDLDVYCGVSELHREEKLSGWLRAAKEAMMDAREAGGSAPLGRTRLAIAQAEDKVAHLKPSHIPA